ncbi:MAG: TetR/AcrR family transcriptional regulator [Solirubrobacteraceae bacterium]|nr:TetR/AcrR family transcriptional regulator [Solirubrobacteraceae bacterium]
MATRTPRLDADTRRRQILDATRRVLARDGFSGLTMEVIAKEAGITRTPLYALFGDLDALLRAAADDVEARALSAIPADLLASPGDASPPQVLAAAAERFLDAVRADPLTWQVLLMPASGRPDTLRRRYEQRRREIIDRVEGLVRWGLAQVGGMPEGADSHVVARMIVAVGEDLGRLVLAEPDRWPPKRVAGAVADIVSLLPAGGGRA